MMSEYLGLKDWVLLLCGLLNHFWNLWILPEVNPLLYLCCSLMILYALLAALFQSARSNGFCLSASWRTAGSNPSAKYACSEILSGSPACDARTEKALM